MTNNPEDLSNVGIILTFCRYCGDEFANLIPRKVKLYLEANPDPEVFETSKLLPLEKQKIVQVLLKDYYSNIVKKYHKDFNELKSTEKTNYRILMTKGEVFAERKKKVEEMNVTFKKLQTHVEQLSDLLDEDIPQLQEEEDNNAKGTFFLKKLNLFCKLMSFSFHFGIFVFGCLWQLSYQNITDYVTAYLLFLLSKARQAKRKFKVKKITQPKWWKNQKRTYQNL